MPRFARIDVQNQTYHVINRANARATIFKSEKDYKLFEDTLIEAKAKFDILIFTFSIMPNHIHLSPWSKKDGELGKFMHWLSMSFTQRYHRGHGTIGNGHLFQSRYKSFIVKDDRYLLQLFLYIERNALKAKLVEKAEDWRWSSLWLRQLGTDGQKKLLDTWPIDMPKNYLETINSDVTIDREEIGLGTKKAGRPRWDMKKM